MIEAPAARPVETVTRIKQSEAIRLGSLVTGQNFGSSVGWSLDSPTTTCAMGALSVGMGGNGTTYHRPDIEEAVQELIDADAGLCPVNGVCAWPEFGYAGTNLRDRIIDLNDNHRWTREQIADWLEGLGY